jgi:hypothetical protein
MEETYLYLARATGCNRDPFFGAATLLLEIHGPPSLHQLGEGFATSTAKERDKCPAAVIDGPCPWCREVLVHESG